MKILRRPRKRHLGGAAAVAAAIALVVSLTNGVSAAPQAATFDLDHGNALTDVIYPALNTEPRVEYSGRPGSWAADRAMLIELPWFDALAAYHPTAVGIFSTIGRRPAEEHTTRNKNIAVIYSAYTSLSKLYPQHEATWQRMMATAGLDPAVTAEDRTTASGIGILAAKNAMAARRNDGTNRDGDAGGRRYNREPYADHTGYRPVNSPYELRFPSRWQPNTISKREVVNTQEFATPQFGRVKPITFDRPEQFRLTPPANHHLLNPKGYRKQADEVLRASAGLDDRKKMSAEIFSDNITPYGAIAHTLLRGRYNTEDSVRFIVMTDVAGFDVAIASWYYMRKYDSVQPFSAIRHLYPNKKLTAWGGPGRGTVNDITGTQWRSYLSSVAIAAPEYPSVNAAVCVAYAQVARRFTGTDKLTVVIPVRKGSSIVEPGVTPAADMMLTWNSYSEWAAECGQSRVWAGENFPASVAAVDQYAPQLGDRAFDFVQRKLNGR
ncbi:MULTISPECIES: vanadium-dependent haloperoxidase [Micromonospora]|uniref:vanadium-dependent haloperoxidase n=1 Tax=Micromonospora TaxID=1873 RepID=UPI0003EED0BF|nr:MULTISPECIES: vanadium-dependent haloperoxidase [Micromonospora]EWM63065.1 hypothetical protein MCBG_00198 [Micromonospora sp. M42]MCK1804489.1 vanadium-dependent haloperoxidase [Micromonospora sp. R42106]MCK1829858.1 vanadium-dependent haloperoxidase [Micromonospora sp. R42003]MCK1841761.1 vanadium-dependent haloperoxidase [Micromonospora sp. R42004]MCM1020047.1 vanadium-dependent haloperoxidase [Micromonospora sp. XM-20-01]